MWTSILTVIKGAGGLPMLLGGLVIDLLSMTVRFFYMRYLERRNISLQTKTVAQAAYVEALKERGATEARIAQATLNVEKLYSSQLTAQQKLDFIKAKYGKKPGE